MQTFNLDAFPKLNVCKPQYRKTIDMEKNGKFWLSYND
ncbi:hypothetical protein CAter282_3432 [Collimonas arenae]|uniref:Uncharacterized protein n=1 Tax=Collimonas arenae TaxID=279058 RepID=A0A127PUC2_9BURK|nr:hypothetical protein CAter10_3760 [Collimonas arenae]AMP11121.1 hypothetical protein CAter282_3432 [Collimonas arenae]